MISLRLSPKEYEAMRSLFPAFGAKNVSDFARLAMQRTLSNSFATASITDRSVLTKLNEMDERLQFVEERVSSLLVARAAQST
jgi:hypothetical protein